MQLGGYIRLATAIWLRDAQQDHDDVIEVVTHYDPASTMSAAEAWQTARSLWDTGVQEGLVRSLHHKRDSLADPLNTVLALFFDRYTNEFRDAVMQSALARSLQEEGFDVRPSWASGGFILVRHFTHGDAAEFRCVLEGKLGK